MDCTQHRDSKGVMSRANIDGADNFVRWLFIAYHQQTAKRFLGTQCRL